MLRTILIHGSIAGLIVGLPNLILMTLFGGQEPMPHAMALGYLIMLVALSTIFVAVKRRRDEQLGGVIAFWPALGLGLAISLVASFFYVVAWEITFAIIGTEFLSGYTKNMVAEAAAKGASPAELAKIKATWEAFWISYRSPLVRIPYTFIEIAPVGLLVSLISAGLLRNPRFLARPRS